MSLFMQRRYSGTSTLSKDSVGVSSSSQSSLVVAPKVPKDADDLEKRASHTIRCQSASTTRANKPTQYALERILHHDNTIPTKPTTSRRPNSARTPRSGATTYQAGSCSSGGGGGLVETLGGNNTARKSTLFRTQPTATPSLTGKHRHSLGGVADSLETHLVPRPPDSTTVSAGVNGNPGLTVSTGSSEPQGGGRKGTPSASSKKKTHQLIQDQQAKEEATDPVINLHIQIAQIQGRRTQHLAEELGGKPRIKQAVGVPASGAPSASSLPTKSSGDDTPPSLITPEEKDDKLSGRAAAADFKDEIMHGATAGGEASIFVSRRMIKERMDRRLNLYRTDASQRKLLKERVARFRAVRGGAMELLDEFGLPVVQEEYTNEERAKRLARTQERGVTILEDYYMEREQKYASLKVSPRDGVNWVDKNRERSTHHRVTANRVWREELAHKKAVINRHEELVAEAGENRQREAEALVACEWANLIVGALRGKQFLKNLVLSQYMAKLRSAFRVRQRYFTAWVVPVRKRMFRERREYLQRRVRFAIMAARIWAGISLKRRGCKILVRFINHLTEAGRFHIALQHYRKKVLRCQQIVRNHLRYRTVRLNLLMLLWDQKEENLRIRLAEAYKQEVLKKKAAAAVPALKPRQLREQRNVGGAGFGGSSSQFSPSASVVGGSPRPGGPRKRGGAVGMATTGPTAKDIEELQEAKIFSLVQHDPFKYDLPIPFRTKLQVLTEDWVARRIVFVKKDIRVRFYADKLDYERRLNQWEKLSSQGGEVSLSLPPRPQPPKLRPFPLFMPTERFDNLVEKTFFQYKEDVMDLRHQAACEVVRTSRPDGDYIPQRDLMMHATFRHDVQEKKRFFAQMQKVVFAAPSIKGPLVKKEALDTPRLSIFMTM